MNKTALLVVMTVLTLLVVACAPKAPVPQAAPEPAAAVETQPVVIEPVTNETVPVAAETVAAPTAGSLTAEQQKTVGDILTALKGQQMTLTQGLTALQPAVQKQSNAALSKTMQDLLKLNAATAPLLDKMSGELGNQDALVKDAIQAREQYDAMIIIASNLQQQVPENADEAFFNTLDSATESLATLAQDYHWNLLGELGQDVVVDASVLDAAEKSADQQLVATYGVSQDDLNGVQELIEMPPDENA